MRMFATATVLLLTSSIIFQLADYSHCERENYSQNSTKLALFTSTDATTPAHSSPFVIVYKSNNGRHRRRRRTKIDDGSSSAAAAVVVAATVSTANKYHATIGSTATTDAKLSKMIPVNRSSANNVSSTENPSKGADEETGHAFFDDDDDGEEYYEDDEDEANEYENTAGRPSHDDGNEENEDGHRVDEETENGDGQQMETDDVQDEYGGESEADTKPSIILRTKKKNHKKRKSGKKHGVKIKIKGLRKLRKFMLPLLLAYKLKFLTLVPLLFGGLMLIVATTGFAGFFFALFAVGLGTRQN